MPAITEHLSNLFASICPKYCSNLFPFNEYFTQFVLFTIGPSEYIRAHEYTFFILLSVRRRPRSRSSWRNISRISRSASDIMRVAGAGRTRWTNSGRLMRATSCYHRYYLSVPIDGDRADINTHNLGAGVSEIWCSRCEFRPLFALSLFFPTAFQSQLLGLLHRQPPQWVLNQSQLAAQYVVMVLLSEALMLFSSFQRSHGVHVANGRQLESLVHSLPMLAICSRLSSVIFAIVFLLFHPQSPRKYWAKSLALET